MANVTIVPAGREVGSRGSLRMESGTFNSLSANIQTIPTKLGRIIYFRVMGAVAGAGDRQGITYYNSKTASAVEDDPGFVTIDGSGMANGFDYAYQAIGY